MTKGHSKGEHLECHWRCAPDAKFRLICLRCRKRWSDSKSLRICPKCAQANAALVQVRCDVARVARPGSPSRTAEFYARAIMGTLGGGQE